jgi:DNA-binding SARP family transcriptional activator/predicted ATPase
MSRIEVTTLGSFRIHADGQPLASLVSSKAALLLVYLAMQRGEHPRKQLAAMFWSETVDEQALKNLRTVLTSLRQALPNALLIERETLAINPDCALHIDALAFEAACAEVLSAPPAPDGLDELQQLADLYQGLFLANVSIREAVALEEWVSERQRQLQGLYTRLLYQVAEVAISQRQYETGLQYAHKLTSLEPYWEAACRQRMLLLAYSHRANDALLHYETFARLLASELDAAPEAETMTLYEQIRAHQLLPPQPAERSTIVLPDMPFVEAVDDLELVERMLNTPQCRLLTIYGISGVGKTTLATQVAYQRQTVYRDGAYVVSLKRAQTARDLPFVIATTLGIAIPNQATPADLEIVIRDTLRDQHLLLVLDGYEHLLPETGCIQRLLEASSQLQMIVTCQTPLSLFREWLFPLQGLRFPLPQDTQPEAFEAVRLFEVTAQRMNPRFTVQEHLADIVEICRLVDGLPLALIIAASWTQIVPIARIKELIADGRAFEMPLHQDLPPHHQSLEMMLEYTWTALAEKEQYALMALAIFQSAFTLEEAEQIGQVDFALMMTMVQRALIQKYGEKYRMHQLVWRYARKKLLFSDTKEALGQRYMAYALRQLGDLQAQQLPLHEYLLAIEKVYDSVWNFDWMARTFQPMYLLTLSRFLMPYWEIFRRDELVEIQARLARIEANDLDADTALLLYLQRARVAMTQDDIEGARRWIDLIFQSDGANGAWGDWGVAFCLSMMMLQVKTWGTNSDEQELDAHILARSYLKLLLLYLDMGDNDAAEVMFPHLNASLSQPLEQALAVATQAVVAAARGRLAQARERLGEAEAQLGRGDGGRLAGVIRALQQRAAVN